MVLKSECIKNSENVMARKGMGLTVLVNEVLLPGQRT